MEDYDSQIQKIHADKLEKATQRAEKKYGKTNVKEIMEEEATNNPKDFKIGKGSSEHGTYRFQCTV